MTDLVIILKRNNFGDNKYVEVEDIDFNWYNSRRGDFCYVTLRDGKIIKGYISGVDKYGVFFKVVSSGGMESNTHIRFGDGLFQCRGIQKMVVISDKDSTEVSYA